MTDLLIRKTVKDFPNVFIFPQYALPLLCNALNGRYKLLLVGFVLDLKRLHFELVPYTLMRLYLVTDLLIRKTVNDLRNVLTFPQYIMPLLCNAS